MRSGHLSKSPGNKVTLTESEIQTITNDEKSKPYNRIISKNVREYHFVVSYRERVELGEIFSIEDDEITFLARVTDIQHASNYGGNWDTIIRDIYFYDEDQIFNRIVSEPLGCVIDDEFRTPKCIPTKFSRVERAEEKKLEFLKQKMGDIEVGFLRNGSKTIEGIPVALHSDVMDHHMGIFATTGMGKSNFMKVFAASCMKLSTLGKSKFGLLIVDPHDEYVAGKNESKGLIHLENYKDGLSCYSTDPKKYSNYHEIEELTLQVKDIWPSDTYALYDWREAQKEVLKKISDTYSRESWMDDVKNGVGDDELQRDYKIDTIKVVRRRIESILTGNKYIDNNKPSSINNIISDLKEGKVVLIDIPNLTESSELFLLSILSRHIYNHYRDPLTVGSKKDCLITIEEAQRVLGGEGNISNFKTIAREGRKFGVGLCAITQQPKLIDKQLLSQFNTFIILRLADKNDRIRLEESAKQDLSSLDMEIQTLERGEAIISTLKVPFPVPARIHEYHKFMGRLNKEKQNRKNLLDDLNCTFK